MAQIYAPRRRASAEPAKTEPYRVSESAAVQPMAAIPDLGAGSALPEQIRSKMESSFGADFSSVRLYESQAVADAGAEAITLGSRIAFAPGRLDMVSSGGQALLGHELSHVVSQARGEVTGQGFLNNHSLEARADREGALAAAGEQVYTGAVTPLSASDVSSAAGPMQAKKAKLGSDEKLKALYNEDGTSRVVQNMDEARLRAQNDGKSRETIFSESMMAAGMRTSGEVADALKERKGSAFAGLSDAMQSFNQDAVKHGRYDLDRIGRERSRNSNTRAFGGNDFSYSPEISNYSADVMKAAVPFLERDEVGQYVTDQYNLIKDAQIFQDERNGTALDAVMTNLFNRDVAGNMVPLQVAESARDQENGTQNANGVRAVNSFLVRLPNLVRDMETGDLDPSNVPEHMLPAMEQYKAIRAHFGSQVDPEKYGAPVAQQPKKWWQRRRR